MSTLPRFGRTSLAAPSEAWWYSPSPRSLTACSSAYLSALPTVWSGPGSAPKAARPCGESWRIAQPRRFSSEKLAAKPEPSAE